MKRQGGFLIWAALGGLAAAAVLGWLLLQAHERNGALEQANAQLRQAAEEQLAAYAALAAEKAEIEQLEKEHAQQRQQDRDRARRAERRYRAAREAEPAAAEILDAELPAAALDLLCGPGAGRSDEAGEGGAAGRVAPGLPDTGAGGATGGGRGDPCPPSKARAPGLQPGQS